MEKKNNIRISLSGILAVIHLNNFDVNISVEKDKIRYLVTDLNNQCSVKHAISGTIDMEVVIKMIKLAGLTVCKNTIDEYAVKIIYKIMADRSLVPMEIPRDIVLKHVIIKNYEILKPSVIVEMTLLLNAPEYKHEYQEFTNNPNLIGNSYNIAYGIKKQAYRYLFNRLINSN